MTINRFETAYNYVRVRGSGNRKEEKTLSMQFRRFESTDRGVGHSSVKGLSNNQSY